jgi:hypothetical protein
VAVPDLSGKTAIVAGTGPGQAMSIYLSYLASTITKWVSVHTSARVMLGQKKS